ncbi:MAG: hypothetical protein ACYC22_10195 [Thiomonas delicata]
MGSLSSGLACVLGGKLAGFALLEFEPFTGCTVMAFAEPSIGVVSSGFFMMMTSDESRARDIARCRAKKSIARSHSGVCAVALPQRAGMALHHIRAQRTNMRITLTNALLELLDASASSCPTPGAQATQPSNPEAVCHIPFSRRHSTRRCVAVDSFPKLGHLGTRSR